MAKVGVGYVSIRNDGTEADRLIGGSATVAGRFEIHASTVEGGVARMRRVDDGIALEPGATVKLASGGAHVMLLDLKEPIVKGQSFDGTLVFERAGTVPVRFSVEGFGAAAAAPSHKGHQPWTCAPFGSRSGARSSSPRAPSSAQHGRFRAACRRLPPESWRPCPSAASSRWSTRTGSRGLG
jgi:copper(I)-binding protein